MCKSATLTWGAVLAVGLIAAPWAAAQDKSPRNKDGGQQVGQQERDAARGAAERKANDAQQKAEQARDEARERRDANQREDADRRNAQRRTGEQRDRDRSTDRNTRERDATDRQPARDTDRRTDTDRDRNADRATDRDRTTDRDRNAQRDRNRADFGAAMDYRDNRLSVSDIKRDSFAARAGLRSGDVIVSVDGRRIDSRDSFQRYLYRSRLARIPIIVLRDNARETIYVQRDWFGRDGRFYDQEVAAGAWLGVFLDHNQPDRCVIMGIERGSPAEQAGLRGGDTILRVNDDEVRSPEDLTHLIRGHQPGDRIELTLGGQAREAVIVTLGERPGSETGQNDRSILPAPTAGVDVNVGPGRGVEVDVYRDRRVDRRGRR